MGCGNVLPVLQRKIRRSKSMNPIVSKEYRMEFVSPQQGLIILHLQPATIWEEIYGNEEFTAFATTHVDHTLQYMLKIEIEKSQCVKRLLKLTVEMKSADVTMEASQILGKHLKVKEFDPKKVRFFLANSVIKAVNTG